MKNHSKLLKYHINAIHQSSSKQGRSRKNLVPEEVPKVKDANQIAKVEDADLSFLDLLINKKCSFRVLSLNLDSFSNSKFHLAIWIFSILLHSILQFGLFPQLTNPSRNLDFLLWSTFVPFRNLDLLLLSAFVQSRNLDFLLVSIFIPSCNLNFLIS